MSGRPNARFVGPTTRFPHTPFVARSPPLSPAAPPPAQICDEFSMLTAQQLQHILMRLLTVHRLEDGSTDVFAHVLSHKALILVGDAQQLPAVCNCP